MLWLICDFDILTTTHCFTRVSVQNTLMENSVDPDRTPPRGHWREKSYVSLKIFYCKTTTFLSEMLFYSHKI